MSTATLARPADAARREYTERAPRCAGGGCTETSTWVLVWRWHPAARDAVCDACAERAMGLPAYAVGGFRVERLELRVMVVA